METLTPYFQRAYPKLAELLTSGTVRVEGMSYVRTAADGTTVIQFGSIHDPAGAEQLLNYSADLRSLVVK